MSKLDDCFHRLETRVLRDVPVRYEQIILAKKDVKTLFLDLTHSATLLSVEAEQELERLINEL